MDASLGPDVEPGGDDAVVVVRNGYLVMNEHYPQDYEAASRGFRGALGCGFETCSDESEFHEFNYYHPAFHPFYRGRDVHTLQSVTKSTASTLIGVAIGRGEIEGTETPLLTFFDGYDLSDVDERLRPATLADLLTMRSGIEWHETDRPFDDTNTVMRLEQSADWIQFTLDQPMDAAPGEKWVYNSGGSHLLSGILRKATGRHADDYARTFLFAPLGIRDFHWKKTPKGLADTEGGLYLEATDLAKIGYLYLNDGVWDGVRILAEGWVEDATARRVDRVDAAGLGYGYGYGYQWWRPDHDAAEIWAAMGFGEQYLLIRQHLLIGVVYSWNLFEERSKPVLAGFIDALVASVSLME